jgi:ADP-heptose:LPS heptosyltransferase
MPKRIIFHTHLAPGDTVAMTAAIRDLHLNHPGVYLTDVRTTAQNLWDFNPYITDFANSDPRIIDLWSSVKDDPPYDLAINRAQELYHTLEQIWEMEQIPAVRLDYPLVHRSCESSCHFTDGFTDYLEALLNIRIRKRIVHPDIHLSAEEKSWMGQVHELTGINQHYWIVVNGGKTDFTAKWWDPARMQKVVNHFRHLTFVQVGEKGHHHVRLVGSNVIDLIGKTDTRQLVRLVYHSSGVICPVTYLMHLAAGVPVNPDKCYGRASRPCVVLGGGRESPRWEAYPNHAYLHTVGMLDCCSRGGCWRSRVVPLQDGEDHDKSLCKYPEMTENNVVIPRCLKMITVDKVIGAIEDYLP